MRQGQPGVPGRLRPVRVKLPNRSAPVVPCQWAALSKPCQTVPELDQRLRSAEEFWSVTAVVGFEVPKAPREAGAGEREQGRGQGLRCCRRLQRLSLPEPPGPSSAPAGEACGGSLGGPCALEGAAAAEGPSHSIVFLLPGAGEAARSRLRSSVFERAANSVASCPDVDWHCLSWPATPPPLGVDRAVQHVLQQSVEAISKKRAEASELGERPGRIQVFLIGHSFGGAVATQAACELTRVFGTFGTGASVSIEGLCVIDTVPHEDRGALELDLLQHARVLLIASHGLAEGVARPTNTATRELYGAVPATRKEMLLLPRNERISDWQLLLRLTDFVLRGHFEDAERAEAPRPKATV